MSVCVTRDSYFAMDERMTVKQMNKKNAKKKIVMIKRRENYDDKRRIK